MFKKRIPANFWFVAGCRAGWGSHITLPAGTSNPSTLPTRPIACPPFQGFYYPQSRSAAATFGLPYKGYGYPTPHPDYSSCKCQKCPAGFTSVGGAIEQSACVLAAATTCDSRPSESVTNAQPWPAVCAGTAVGEQCRARCRAGFT
jgi:hypothetical protein